MRWKIFSGALSAKILIDFLERLTRQQRWKIFLILDNLRVHRKRLVFPSGIWSGVSLTMWSWLTQRERNRGRNVAFEDGGRLQRSGRLSN
jgi:hypothetical protein